MNKLLLPLFLAAAVIAAGQAFAGDKPCCQKAKAACECPCGCKETGKCTCEPGKCACSSGCQGAGADDAAPGDCPCSKMKK